MKIENAPELRIDQILYSADKPIPVHVIRERRIVWNLLKHLEANGVIVNKVWDGDEMIIVRSKKDAMEVIFDRDDAQVRFNGPGDKSNQWVFLVLGNDTEIITDYTTGLESIISKFNPEAFA